MRFRLLAFRPGWLRLAELGRVLRRNSTPCYIWYKCVLSFLRKRTPPWKLCHDRAAVWRVGKKVIVQRWTGNSTGSVDVYLHRLQACVRQKQGRRIAGFCSCEKSNKWAEDKNANRNEKFHEDTSNKRPHDKYRVTQKKRSSSKIE